jgi:hypothetical protein
MSETQSEDRRARRTGRSPSYPGIDLEAAIERARTIYQHEKMHPADISTIAAHWGYTNPTSGLASTQYAALKKFGLLVEEGSKSDRRGQLTPLAQEILLAPEPQEAIKTAALTPPIHREMWDKYGLDLPSDRTLHWWLVKERGFTEPGATDFIKQYRATLAFALPEGDSFEDQADAEGYQPDVDDAPVVPPMQHRPNPNEPRRPPVVDVWQTSSGAVHVPAPEPQVTARTSRHSIPLVGGKQVVLEGEFPLTEAAWQGFIAVLQAFKPGLVEAEPTPAAPVTAPTPAEFIRGD